MCHMKLMKYLYTITTISFTVILSSCTAPYGNGTQRLIPKANVENLERQAPVTPHQGAGLDGYTAAKYGQGSRFY